MARADFSSCKESSEQERGEQWEKERRRMDRPSAAATTARGPLGPPPQHGSRQEAPSIEFRVVTRSRNSVRLLSTPIAVAKKAQAGVSCAARAGALVLPAWVMARVLRPVLHATPAVAGVAAGADGSR